MDQGIFNASNMYRKVVKEESMPRELYYDLDHAERKKLVGTITKEYYTELKKWLTETKCTGEVVKYGAAEVAGKKPD